MIDRNTSKQSASTTIIAISPHLKGTAKVILKKRVDRLERILRAMIRMGRRLRTDVRDQEEKIIITINAQLQTEDQLTSLRDMVNDELSELQESRKEVDRRLDDLTEAINILRTRS